MDKDGVGYAFGDMSAEGPVPPPDYLDLVRRMVGGEDLLAILQGGANAIKSGKGAKVSPSVQVKLSTVELEMGKLAHEVTVLRQVQQHLNSVLENLDEENKLFRAKQAEIEEIMKIIRKDSSAIAIDIMQRVEIKKEKSDQEERNVGGLD